MSKYIKVHQYQIELEGGMRYGPLWNHKPEAEAFNKKINDPEITDKKRRVRKIWIKALSQKFRFVEPERVKHG